MCKVNTEGNKTMIESQPAITCRKLIYYQITCRCRFSAFIVDYEQISTPCSSVSNVNFKHVIADWDLTNFFMSRRETN